MELKNGDCLILIISSYLGSRQPDWHPTVLDTPCGTQDDGEPLVFLESDEPAVKRRRDYKDDAQCNEKIPREFMAEWVATPKGILPFVKNMETGVVQCGFVKMKVLHFKSASGCDDYKSVVCLDGCDTVDCKKKQSRM